ncbi:uncharacterized protein [Gossypium hirsutum]|uniref:Uncharacterized protein isoform X3 n=1 Tax=Gossypium hirsutum TaxID=3635 RepID=A0ABM3C2T1_GOSHI|nr:uncharacterized protein LOC107960020 isoform X3 [Gossypium hirsutum]
MPDDLGDFFAELKLSFFQLGISPQIIASIIMQMVDFTWLCNSRSCYSCLLFSSVFNLCSQLQVLWAKHVMVTSFFWFVVQ